MYLSQLHALNGMKRQMLICMLRQIEIDARTKKRNHIICLQDRELTRFAKHPIIYIQGNDSQQHGWGQGRSNKSIPVRSSPHAYHDQDQSMQDLEEGSHLRASGGDICMPYENSEYRMGHPVSIFNGAQSEAQSQSSTEMPDFGTGIS